MARAIPSRTNSLMVRTPGSLFLIVVGLLALGGLSQSVDAADEPIIIQPRPPVIVSNAEWCEAMHPALDTSGWTRKAAKQHLNAVTNAREECSLFLATEWGFFGGMFTAESVTPDMLSPLRIPESYGSMIVELGTNTGWTLGVVQEQDGRFTPRVARVID